MASTRETIGILKVPVVADLGPFEKAAKEDLRRRASQHGKAAAVELTKQLKEGTQKAGTEVADNVARGMRKQFRVQLATARKEFFEGLIDKNELERRGREAAQRLNKGVLAEIRRRQASGTLKDRDLLGLTSMLRDVDHTSKRMGDSVSGAFGRIRYVVAGVFAAIAGSRLVGFLRETASTAIGVVDSQIKLAATARLFNIEQSELLRLARETRDEFRLSIGVSNELAAVTTKFAAQAGNAAQAQEFLRRALDLGAAQGLDAVATTQALQQALIGLDEGTDKLLQKNPSQVFAEFAAQTGRSAESLTDLEKKQALVNAIMTAGVKVQGAYSQSLSGNRGELRKWDQMILAGKEMIGSGLIPVLAKLAANLNGEVSGAFRGLTRLIEGLLSPTEQAIARLQRLGVAAEILAPLQTRQQITDSRANISRLQGSVRGLMHFGGKMPTIDEVEREIAKIEPDALGGDAGAARKLELLRAGLATLQQIRMEEDAIRQAERDLVGLDARAAKMREIADIENQIAELQKQGESAGRNLVEQQLNARKAQLQKDLGVGTGTTGSAVTGLTPEQLAEAKRLNDEAKKLLDKWYDTTRNSAAQRLHELKEFEAAAKRLGDNAALKSIHGEMAKARKELEGIEQIGKTGTEFLNLAAVQMPKLLNVVPKATSMAAPAVARYEATVARLKEQLARGLISDSEFVEKEKAAADQLNKQLFRILDSIRAMGVLTDEQHAALVGMLRQGTNEASGLTEQLDKVVTMARGILSVADAFGEVSDETRKALDGVVSLAEGIRAFAGGDKIGGAIQIFGGLGQLFSGFFGESAAERERRQIIESNTDALRAVALELSGFRPTGSAIGGARRALGEFVTDRTWRDVLDGGQSRTPVFREAARNRVNELVDELAKFGLSLDELDALAKEYGITIRRDGKLTGDGLLALYERLQQAEKALVGFRNTLDDQRAAMDLRADIFDESADPQARLQREMQLLQKFAPALFARMGGADPSTALGRATIEQAVRALFEAFMSGDINLENLTREEFLDILGNIEGFLDELAAGGPGAQPTSFQVSRTITEVTGNRLVGLLTTDVHWNEITARHTEHIAAILDRYVGAQVSVPLPSEVRGNFGVVAPSMTFSPQISVPVALEHTSIRPGEERAVAQEIGSEVATVVNRKLGAELRSMMRAMGRH